MRTRTRRSVGKTRDRTSDARDAQRRRRRRSVRRTGGGRRNRAVGHAGDASMPRWASDAGRSAVCATAACASRAASRRGAHFTARAVRG
ncbi:hypothetical protein CA831_32105, partial [Burkholderia multivorans]